MKRNLWLWQFGGFTVATALGTILHFLFAWTGWICLAPVSAVNESTWEHIKILFFPTLLFACIQSVYFRQEYAGFWQIKTMGILIGAVSIPVLFYTYQGAFGSSPDWLNILFFFLSAGLSYGVEWVLFRNNFAPRGEFLSKGILVVISALFFIFTFAPPRVPLFQDPLSQGYGISTACYEKIGNLNVKK